MGSGSGRKGHIPLWQPEQTKIHTNGTGQAEYGPVNDLQKD